MADQHPGTRVREQVRAHYAAAAITVATGAETSCCTGAGTCGHADSGPGASRCGPGVVEQPGLGAGLYSDAERSQLPADRAERGDHVGCIAGALSVGEYRDGLAAAGFTGIEITPTHQLAGGIHSAIIRAVNPGQ
jgi:hypothetical protein